MSAAQVQPTGDPLSPERDALDRILRSDVLHRAPNLILFLRYVCEMQLAGRTDSIKEYNIAVEALGRGSDFDQKKDSIVRVEAHRLRKRLADYYVGPGASDPVQILLPPGSYVPVFRQAATPDASPVNDVAEPETVPATAPEPETSPGFRWLFFLLAGIALILTGAIEWWQSRSLPKASPSGVIAPVVPPAAAEPDAAIRISAGNTQDGFPDGTGLMWQKDRFFSGGQIFVATPRSILRTTDDPLYLTRREGEFEYKIPVPAGNYELRLHFAETVFGEDNVAGGGESSRVFHIQVNDGPLWQADIVSEAAGANTATIRVYRNVQPAADGAIHVAFRSLRKEAPFVNGIEVLPAPDGRTLPVRIVPRSSPLVTPSGEKWWNDRYWLGGTTVQRHEPVDGPEPSNLYQSERYGNFSYSIPVAVGARYALTLRFAETWFGESRPGGNGAGTRVFDVYCNGRALLKNFDVYREAGGPLRQLKKVFRDLEPNAQGKLELQFVPIRNYAMINAIEVVDEGH